MNLFHVFEWRSKIAVKPLTAQVATAVVILTVPVSFGADIKIAPLPRSYVRMAPPKLKTVFAPSRVSVWSRNVSSARESVPVRTAVPSRTVSFTVAGRAAVCPASKRTSWITSVTRACFCSAAKRRLATPAAVPIKQMAATRFEFGKGVFIGVIVDRITDLDPGRRAAVQQPTVAGSSRPRRQKFHYWPVYRFLQNRNSLDYS